MNPIWTLAQAVATSITGGANFVVFRETDLPTTPRNTVLEFVTKAVRGRTPLVVMATNADSAVEDSYGVHFEGDISGIDRCNRLENQLVGVTVSSLNEIAVAESASADYLLAYFDWTFPEQSLLALKKYVDASRIPLVVGVDVPKEYVKDIMSMGATGIAISFAACGAYDKTSESAAYWDLMTS